LRMGTTTLEAKTGYGHTPEAELRHLAVVAGIDHPVSLVPTFMPLHRQPPNADAGGLEEYLSAMEAAIPAAAQLAEYCDVCCDRRCFDESTCRRISEAAREAGMRIRVHADQNGWIGGVQFAVDIG